MAGLVVVAPTAMAGLVVVAPTALGVLLPDLHPVHSSVVVIDNDYRFPDTVR